MLQKKRYIIKVVNVSRVFKTTDNPVQIQRKFLKQAQTPTTSVRTVVKAGMYIDWRCVITLFCCIEKQLYSLPKITLSNCFLVLFFQHDSNLLYSPDWLSTQNSSCLSLPVARNTSIVSLKLTNGYLNILRHLFFILRCPNKPRK